MLRAAGFEAWNALLLTEGGDNIDEAPGLTWFDHVIVRVGGSQPFWIDATAFDTLPAGMLPSIDQGRMALVASERTTRLERLPVASAESNRSRVEVRLEFAEIGPGGVTEVHSREGNLVGTWRPLGPKGISDARERWEKWAGRTWDAPSLSRFDIVPGALIGPARMELSAKDARAVWATRSSASFRPDIERVFAELPRSLTGGYDPIRTPPRKSPLVTRPHVSELVYTVVPPTGFRARPLPGRWEARLGPAAFHRTDTQLPDRSVRVELRFQIDALHLTAEEVNAFRASLAELRARPVEPIVLEATVSAAIERGQLREAIERSRVLMSREPGNGMHHVRMARALLEAGLAERARTEARRAVELTPSSPEAWAELGQILTHDLRGLPYGPGWDRDEAIAATRKALALREDGATAGQLALIGPIGLCRALQPALHLLAHRRREGNTDEQSFRRQETADSLSPGFFPVLHEHSISIRFELLCRRLNVIDIEFEPSLWLGNLGWPGVPAKAGF